MKYLNCVFLICGFCLFWDANAQVNNKPIRTNNYNYLKANFQNPSNESGINCWWWWLNGNVTKAAITKDLEAMKSRNFHGAMIFDAGGHNQRGNKDIPEGPLFGSDEWNELFVFALDEAKRLGLEMGFNIQSGWNLGGRGLLPNTQRSNLFIPRGRFLATRRFHKSLKCQVSKEIFTKTLRYWRFRS